MGHDLSHDIKKTRDTPTRVLAVCIIKNMQILIKLHLLCLTIIFTKYKSLPNFKLIFLDIKLLLLFNYFNWAKHLVYFT